MFAEEADGEDISEAWRGQGEDRGSGSLRGEERTVAGRSHTGLIG